MQNEAANITIALSQSFQVLSIYTYYLYLIETILNDDNRKTDCKFANPFFI